MVSWLTTLVTPGAADAVQRGEEHPSPPTLADQRGPDPDRARQWARGPVVVVGVMAVCVKVRTRPGMVAR